MLFRSASSSSSSSSASLVLFCFLDIVFFIFGLDVLPAAFSTGSVEFPDAFLNLLELPDAFSTACLELRDALPVLLEVLLAGTSSAST